MPTLDTGRKQRIFRWAIALAVLVALVAVWKMRQPGRFTWVGEYRAVTLPAGATTGFLIHATGNRFTFFDWDGQRKWSVQTAPPSVPDFSDRVPTGLSTDGHAFVAGLFYGKTMQLTCWQDGRQRWTTRVPMRQPVYASTMVGSNWAWLTVVSPTRVFLDVTSEARMTGTAQRVLYLIENGAYAACCACDARGAMAVAPDGRCVIRARPAGRSWQSEYCDLIRCGTRLVLTPQWSHTDNDLNFQPFGYGIAVINDRLYHRAGCLKILKPRPGLEGISDTFVVLDRPKALRIISSTTLDHWDLPVPSLRRLIPAYAPISANERYVFLYTQQRILAPLRLLARYVPGCDRLASHEYHQYYRLYERPGNLHALLVTTLGHATIQGHHVALDIRSNNYATLAPTPHHRVLLSASLNNQKEPNVYLLGW